jgi:hypothetical protein
MARASKPRKDKPLFVIDGPVKASVYSSTFQPFAITKFLDYDKLRVSRKTSVEVGTIEGGGWSGTLAVTIQRGKITELSVQSCGCGGKSKGGMAKRRTAMREIGKRLDGMTEAPVPTMPVALAQQLPGEVFRLPFPWGPIIIIWEPQPDGGACIGVKVGEKNSVIFCVLCSEVGFIQCF